MFENTPSSMVEVRVRPVERFQVTRCANGVVETVASDLTSGQADNVAMAFAARADADGKQVLVEAHDGVSADYHDWCEAGLPKAAKPR